jgi:hypothetical protein
MRKIKLLLLSLATASFASVYDGKTEPAKTEVSTAAVETSTAIPQPSQVKNADNSQQGHRNSFFFETDIGARYMKVSYKEYEEYYDEKSDVWIIGDNGNATRRRFKGYGPDIGMKFGGVISDVIALFCNLELSTLEGTFKGSRTVNGKKKSNADFDTDAIRFAIGGGVMLFVNTDMLKALNGTFIGVTANIIAEEAGSTSDYYDHDELEISESGLSFGLQVGKIWGLSDNWNVGFAAKGSLENGIRDGSSGNASDSYTIAVDLVVMRK